MIRNDGSFTFYQIQHKWDAKSNWVLSSYNELAEVEDPEDNFSASGKCYQDTGQHGVLKVWNANTGLLDAKRKMALDYANDEIPNPIKLRIVKVTIKQETVLSN